MRYTSEARLLGLPILEVCVGPDVAGTGAGGSAGIARAWIAIGDVAFGVLAAIGGLSMGCISIGGASMGVLAFGGFALGGLSLGGGAMGAVLAVGGAAFSLYAAIGGLGVSGLYAIGGQAMAPHANDAAARAFMHLPGIHERLLAAVESTPLFHLCWLFVLLPLLIGRRCGNDGGPMITGDTGQPSGGWR